MNKIPAIALLACFLLSSCASTSGKHEMTKRERTDLLIETATAALNEGDPTSSLINLTEAEKLDTHSASIQYLLDLTYYQKGETTLAIASARKAVQWAPAFSPAKNTLGKLLLDQGKLPEAEKYLSEAAHDLTFREAYIAKTNLGILYNKKANSTLAEQWFSKAIFDGSDRACMASFYRGQIYFEKGEFEKANSDFRRASKNSCSQFSDAHLAMGRTFLRMKKYDQARAKLLEVQQLFPTSDAAAKANDYLREIP